MAALTPPGWEIRIIDENLRLENGLHWKPDVVALTALTPNAPRAYELALQYRAAGAAVVIGGCTLRHCPMRRRSSWMPSSWGRRRAFGERYLLTSRRVLCRGAMTVGLIAYAISSSPGAISILGVITEVALTSKGCSGHCDFCSIWRFYNRRYRVRPVDAVVEELATLSPRKLVFLADDNLTQQPQRVIELCRALVARGVRRPLAVQGGLILADNEELLAWLKRAGCVYVFVGLETLNADALAHVGKPNLLGSDSEGYRSRIAPCTGMVSASGSFIVGLDDDTPEVFPRSRMAS